MCRTALDRAAIHAQAIAITTELGRVTRTHHAALADIDLGRTGREGIATETLDAVLGAKELKVARGAVRAARLERHGRAHQSGPAGERARADAVCHAAVQVVVANAAGVRRARGGRVVVERQAA